MMIASASECIARRILTLPIDADVRCELLRGRILQISNFKDDSSPLAWDCSTWVRTYALFLEERLECYRVLKYDIEAERLTRSSPGASKVHSRTRLSTSDELLEQLPALQQLLYRLMGCQPEGAACSNYLIQNALALVLKESFKIYCANQTQFSHSKTDVYYIMLVETSIFAMSLKKAQSFLPPEIDSWILSNYALALLNSIGRINPILYALGSGALFPEAAVGEGHNGASIIQRDTNEL